MFHSVFQCGFFCLNIYTSSWSVIIFPVSSFSHAVIVGTTAYIAGLIGNDPETTDLVSEDTGVQTDQVSAIASYQLYFVRYCQ